MANLRVHKKKGNYDEELKQQLKDDLKCVEAEIKALKEKKKVLNISLLEIEIKPFKIGGYALSEIPSGRSRKWQKCLLECEDGLLYARPVKEDGTLSGRHFSILPFNGKTYSDYLKEVK